MIESYENALQIAALCLCACAAAYRAFRAQSKAWTFLSFFYGSWLLGDVYWLVSLIFFEETPQISVVSDLSWYATFIFLYMLLRQAAPLETQSASRILPWSGPVFAAGMAVFFMLRGEIVSNLLYAALMGFLLFATLRRLCEGKRSPGQTALCGMILAYCLLIYALWTSSCFWTDDTLLNPYYWCDFLVTVSFPLFLMAAKKAVAV